VTFTPDTVEKEDARLKPCSKNLLNGHEYGTALDAHALILLARIKDVDLDKLVHPDMLAYGKAIMEGDMWKNFMQGRITMHIPEGGDYWARS
jgi:hypothetical protein